MIKELAWNTFKNTGDINTFLELVEIESIEKNNINLKDITNGDNKDKGNYNF